MPLPLVVILGIFTLLLLNDDGAFGGICGSKELKRMDSAPQLHRHRKAMAPPPLRRTKSTPRKKKQLKKQHFDYGYESWDSVRGGSSGFNTSSPRDSQSSRPSSSDGTRNKTTKKKKAMPMYGGHRMPTYYDMVDRRLSVGSQDRQVKALKEQDDRMDQLWTDFEENKVKHTLYTATEEQWLAQCQQFYEHNPVQFEGSPEDPARKEWRREYKKEQKQQANADYDDDDDNMITYNFA